MLSVLRVTLDRIVVVGNLTMVDVRGNETTFGDGTGTPVRAVLADRKVEWQIVLNPHLFLGEAYMDGRISFEQGRIYDFLEIMLSNIEKIETARWIFVVSRLRYVLRWIQQYNPAKRARKNVAHHYDLDGAMYDLFLDEDRQYSCAYFETPDASLEEAQLAKKRHLAAKLDVQDGQRILDIGSGWGGMAIYLAGCANVDVTGITLSEEQIKVSCERRERRGLERQIDFRLLDYRLLDEKFDRIVSVGMFEHVGVMHIPDYFRQVKNLLTDDGVAVIHSIGRSDGPGVTNSWINKYIFPGGYIPALSEVIPIIEQQGLYVTDVEILRLHYAETLRHWRARFLANWDKAKSIYDERFCRMWEFYLSASETAFRYEGMMVFQIQLAKDQNALPITRDYIQDWETGRRRVDASGDVAAKLAGE